jgi:outer membrane protein assembly factor BamB
VGLAAALIVLLILAVLLACFGVAAIAEFRSRPRTAGLPLRIMEIAAGVVASLALPSRFWGSTGLSPAGLSWTMVWISLLMAGLALASKYASRTALVLVMLGNGMLAFFWYYNGAYHDVTDDRTDRISWQYQWETEDPADSILERLNPGSISKHGAIFQPPAIGPSGTIYLLRSHTYTEPKGLSLVAFDPNWLWEIRPEGGICTLPAIGDDGTILFGTGRRDAIQAASLDAGQAGVWAVSPEGKKKWTYEFPPTSFIPARNLGYGSVVAAKSPACSQPAIAADGTTYWLGHGVYALTSDGNLRWAFDPGEDFYFVCIGPDGVVYALANGALFALAPDGTEKWKYPFAASDYFRGDLAVGADGTIYLTNNGPGGRSPLSALTPQGKLKWRNQSYNFAGKALVAADGTIYENIYLERDTAVVALNPNGKATWSTPEASNALEVSSDGTLYICFVRDLFAMSPRGKMLWKAQLPRNPDLVEAFDPTKAITLGPNGKFYIGDFLGQLGTFDAPAGLAASGWPARFHDARNTARAGAR